VTRSMHIRVLLAVVVWFALIGLARLVALVA
jgi:hypothetical protein